VATIAGCCGSAARAPMTRRPSRTIQGPGRRPRRSTPPPLPEGCQQLVLSAETVTLREAPHVLARRHPAAGYRKVCSRARRAGFVVNRKKVARLLHEWGFTRKTPGRIPKPRADRSTSSPPTSSGRPT